MALYAIGDLHGCAKTLDALLDRLALTSADRLVFVGDYIDRGPDARGVIDRLLDLEEASWQGTGPVCTFLRGNHDQMMLDHLNGTGDYDLWLSNGGVFTLESYASAGEVRIPPAHASFLAQTTLLYDTPEAAFVHAGLDPALSVEENLRRASPDVLLWTRDHLDADLSAWEKVVVCGHTPVAEPINRPQLIGIDTGAVFAGRPGLGRLTAVRLPEREFIAVDNCEVL